MPLLHEVIEYLSTIAIVEDQVDQERLKTSVAELDEYRNFHARRLLRSLELIQKWRPVAAGPKILELGAAPYYFTALLYRYFPDCQLIGANVRARLEEDPASAARPEKVTLQHGSGGHRNELPVYVFNVESANYPFPTASFDWVLCMELIEHLAYSPTHMLAEAHRVLKQGGRLLLTTPNAVDLRKTLDFLFNRAPGFRYSGYGIYGRHNREFTVSELCALVEACGYRVLEARLENVIPMTRWVE